MSYGRDLNINASENLPVGRDLAAIGRELSLSADAVAWLGRVKRPATSSGPILPGDAEATEQLKRLGVYEADRAETLASRPNPHADLVLWWILDLAYHEMLAMMGDPAPAEGPSGWPVRFSPEAGPVGRHLPVWMYLAILPEVRRYHAERGIPEDVSRDSLAGLAAEMRKHRSITGLGGIGLFGFGISALRLFRGSQYRLGQLEYNREISLSGARFGHLVSVHIPPVRPLDPSRCEESLSRARRFFLHHFPEEPVASFTCSSWLLDPQLAKYLPERSNIIQFQRRFHLLPLDTEAALPAADGDVAEYVFGRTYHDLSAYPQETTLHRAYVAHRRAGGHWHERTGWLPF